MKITDQLIESELKQELPVSLVYTKDLIQQFKYYYSIENIFTIQELKHYVKEFYDNL